VAYIMQYLEERPWPAGTVLVIPSSVPPFLHFVMVDFTDFHSGVEMAIHNMPGIGVARAPLDDVINGKRVTVRWTPPTHEDGKSAILRMQSLVGGRYDLIEANCEHIIRWAVTGEWKSEQVATVQVGLVIAAAVAMASTLRSRG
jgi:Lecithin retinol acyltransferase